MIQTSKYSCRPLHYVPTCTGTVVAKVKGQTKKEKPLALATTTTKKMTFKADWRVTSDVTL